MDRTPDHPDKLPIRMLHDRVLVRQDTSEGERRSGGGILIPATAAVGRRLAWAEVVAVGQKTEAQRGAHAAKGDRAQGGVEKRLKSLMGLTGPVALAAGFGVVGGGLLRGRHLEDLVGSGVSLAVAAVPEGLPLLATAAQLAAAERLSRRGVLVRNVRSIEALGRVDVLIACGEFAPHVVAGAGAAGMPSHQSAACRTAEETIPRLHQTLGPGDVVLVKGSRAMAMERVVSGLDKLASSSIESVGFAGTRRYPSLLG